MTARRRRWTWILVGCGAALVVLLALAGVASQTAWFRIWLRDQAVERLATQWNGRIAIGALEGSVEFRTPIRGNFGGVVFFDVGEVRRQPHSWTLGDLQFGAGIGVRYHTIVGPLRLDLGFPFEAPRGEPSWQIHFSIGQAF